MLQGKVGRGHGKVGRQDMPPSSSLLLLSEARRTRQSTTARISASDWLAGEASLRYLSFIDRAASGRFVRNQGSCAAPGVEAGRARQAGTAERPVARRWPCQVIEGAVGRSEARWRPCRRLAVSVGSLPLGSPRRPQACCRRASHPCWPAGTARCGIAHRARPGAAGGKRVAAGARPQPGHHAEPAPHPTCRICGTVMRTRGSGSSIRCSRKSTGALSGTAWGTSYARVCMSRSSRDSPVAASAPRASDGGAEKGKRPVSSAKRTMPHDHWRERARGTETAREPGV
jgi:hypothetical protein